MARTTARQAFTRARSRREKGRYEATKTRLAARTKYLQLMSDLKEIAETQSATNSSRSANALRPASQEIDNSLPQASSKSRARSRKNVSQNTKITDYYTVLSRGRENMSKSPPHETRSQILLRPSRGENPTDHRKAQGITSNRAVIDNPETITISDSEETDGGHVTNVFTDRRMKFDPDPANPSDASPLVKLNVSFKDLNVSVKVDEDIEIVDMLPPICLRDHPVVDLED